MLDDLSLTAHDLYMREMRQTPQLTSDEEAQLLLDLASDRDVRQVRERLAAGYQPLVNGLAKRFVRHCRGVELLDLVQDGNEALVHALEKYDVRRGESSFRTFAFTWIRTALLAVVWQYQGALRLPMHELRAIRQMGLITTRLLAELGREPTLAEMAVEMEVSEKDVRDLIVLQEQAVVSIHAFPDGDEDCTLEDTIVDPLSLADSDEDLRDLLADALVMLPDRERIVINLRYGFEDGQARTQKEVAYLLGVSAARVAQLDRRAQMRLRKLLCAA